MLKYSQRIEFKKVFSLVLLLAVTQILNCCFAAASPSYTINVDGIRGDKGVIRISLYNNEASYKTRSKAASYRVGVVPVRNGRAVWQLSNVPPGNYAVLFYHDENKDSEFNKNFLGIPNEGYGFSGNKMSKTSVPSFKEAMFPLDPGHRSVTVHMQYW